MNEQEKINPDNHQNEQGYYKVLLDHRNLLVDTAREGARSLDKAILTLSSGAIAISLTFINSIAPKFDPETQYILNTSWVSLTMSMMSTLISFFSSHKACSDQIKLLDKEISLLSEDPSKIENEKSIETTLSENKWSKATEYLNVVSIFLFIIGICFLLFFVGINLKTKNL